ncbi:DoxX family protein [Ornithinimicrobium sp. F0845]|uniref:DoxX family protein n=1 Tax=Ornithinimicrobium sp. F0845 TaxID=2926412 RepID=UPI001FF4FE59|nr:DoxX family protein [Ornithinimicrobium sp. F0845]MCK0114231.1 DoxX family protein [Ornithinimicrobium sp. F0845]
MDVTSVDLGLLILRVGLALILFAHATQKLLGWFSGSGPEASAKLFELLGQRPGRAMVYLAATCEMAAAVSLLLGLLVPLGVAVGVGTMLVAGSSLTQLKGTFWNAAGGGEYPFFIALVIAALGFLGPGTIALDDRLSLPLDDQPLLRGTIAVAVALVAAVPPILRGRQAVRATLPTA